MDTHRIKITERAANLLHQISQATRGGPLAFHITWQLSGGTSGNWVVGLTPEADILAASPDMQEQIIAGRSNGILVVVDGPGSGRAKERKIEIDASNDLSGFRVSVLRGIKSR